MKSKKYLITELKKIFKSEINKNVKVNDKIYDYDSWDSLANFNILLECEKKFNLKFKASEFNNLNSFKKISEIVKSRKKN